MPTDKERLDWIDQQQREVYCDLRKGGGMFSLHYLKGPWRRNLRAAIDAAMRLR